MDPTQQVCRFCLTEDDLLTDYTLHDDAVQAKISIVFSFSLDSYATLPSSICTSCYLKIDEYYIFTETVRQNQEHLIAREMSIPQVNLKLESDEPMILEEPIRFQEYDSIDYQTATIKSEVASGEVVDEADEAQAESDEPNQCSVQSQDEIIQSKIEFEDTALQSEGNPSVDRFNRTAEEDRLIKQFFGLNCETCSEQFDNIRLLRKHTKQKHKKKLIITCCNKQCTLRYQLLEHIDLHMNPHQFRCDSCGKSYSRKRELENHRLLVHSSNESWPFKCDHCARSYPKRHMLSSHLILHDKNKVTCDVCNKVYTNRKTLLMHKARIHVEAVHECTGCDRKFKQKSVLEEHYAVVHTGEKRYRCNLCGMRTKSRSNLYMHKKRKHGVRETETSGASNYAG